MEPILTSSNYYEVLGLESSCEIRDIKIAYRRLAKKYHPDKNKDKDSQQAFVSISHAYEILSDEVRRKEYDDINKSSSGFSFDFDSVHNFRDDIEYWANVFNSAFREVSGEDVNVYCRLTLQELKSGCKKTITLSSGKISITIKPDTKPNSILKVEGKGNPTTECSTPGDLFINLVPKPDPKFKILQSGDIQITKKLTFQDLILGKSLTIDTLNSKVKMAIPKFTDINSEFRLKGLGLGGKDFILKFNLYIPKVATAKEISLIEKLDKCNNFKLGSND